MSSTMASAPMTYNTLIPIAYKKNCVMAEDAGLKLRKSLLQRHLWQKLQHMFSETDDVEELATSPVLTVEELNVVSAQAGAQQQQQQQQQDQHKTLVDYHREQLPVDEKQFASSVETDFFDSSDDEEDHTVTERRVPYATFDGPASLSDVEDEQMQAMDLAADDASGVRVSHEQGAPRLYVHGQCALTTSHKRFNKASNASISGNSVNKNSKSSDQDKQQPLSMQPWPYSSSQTSPRHVV